jgi:ribonuclease HII
LPLRKSYTKDGTIEAGCDEAGRGCLAGPVYAAAVILPPGFRNKWINDSKKLTEKDRYELRPEIEEKAVAFAVGFATHHEVDQINILKASFLSMHRAVDQLTVRPGLLLIDGNRFAPYPGIAHHCVVGGDAKFMSIAAASILAKTYRDDFMKEMDKQFPQYGWARNMGYGTREHRDAIHVHGFSPIHRLTFNAGQDQYALNFQEDAG